MKETGVLKGHSHSDFKLTLEKIKRNKAIRESGKDISISFPFERFSKFTPGIQQGRYYIVTANSKVGKTKLTDFLFLYNPLKFISNSKTNIRVKILYFSLEMSKEDKIKELISHFLYVKTGIRLPPDLMDSVYKNYILKDEVLKVIEDLTSYFEDLLSNIVFYDNIRNPFGIYKTVREYAHKNGFYIDNMGNKLDTGLIEKGTDEAKRIYQYIPNNEDEFVIVITDHISLLTPEKGESLHDAIGKFSSHYCLNIRDRWKYVVVNVQQQAASQESIDNYQINMLRPSANGLADNKLTGRDCDMMLGLFAPVRFRKEIWEGYNIRILKDNFREISIVLNRRGGLAISGLFFDGAINNFYELPSSEEMTKDLYNRIIEYQKNKL